MRLFIVQLRPTWTYARMAADHERLIDELERRGADALRDHLAESAAAVLELPAKSGVDAGASPRPAPSPA
ncbi:MAG TPA: hypothetical protein VGW10_12485 [Solirubrobacteraceae bacterium]|nr:hypothetical protein [Solirubrobacteraceae bacterium]